MASMWQSLGRHFHDPRLQQLFGRYATYCGSSPFAAPSTLMLVAHVETQGVWTVRGGMVEVGRALARLAERAGARIRTSAHVEAIEMQQGRVCGVRLTGGEMLPGESSLDGVHRILDRERLSQILVCIILSTLHHIPNTGRWEC
jgi:1-hydroxycarotenoid 3,4-desaturase